MSLNDRCMEAAYALRQGTPIEDTPELRAALITLLDSMADGWRGTGDFRPAVEQITQRGIGLGHDYYRRVPDRADDADGSQ